MTAELKTVGIVEFPPPPWAGVGVDISGFTRSQILVKAGLNWGVSKRPMFCYASADDGSSIGYRITVPRQYAVVRSDNNAVLGTVGEQYVLQSNAALVDTVEDILGGSRGAARYESAGVLRGGQHVWVLVRLNGDLRVAKTDDVIARYLLLHNSHDGSTTLRLSTTATRMYCGNQLTTVELGVDSRSDIRHTSGIDIGIADLYSRLSALPGYWKEFTYFATAMSGISMTAKSLNAYFSDVLGVDISQADKGKTKATYDTLVSAFETSPGNQLPGVKNSLWAAFNAFSHYTTYSRSIRGTLGFQSLKEARLASVLIGKGRDLNRRAWGAAINCVLTK